MNTDWGMFSLYVICAAVIITGMWVLGKSSETE